MNSPDVPAFRRCRLFICSCPAELRDTAASQGAVEWVGQPFLRRPPGQWRVAVWIVAQHRTQAAKVAARFHGRDLDEGRPYWCHERRALALGLPAGK